MVMASLIALFAIVGINIATICLSPFNYNKTEKKENDNAAPHCQEKKKETEQNRSIRCNDHVTAVEAAVTTTRQNRSIECNDDEIDVEAASTMPKEKNCSNQCNDDETTIEPETTMTTTRTNTAMSTTANSHTTSPTLTKSVAPMKPLRKRRNRDAIVVQTASNSDRSSTNDSSYQTVFERSEMQLDKVLIEVNHSEYVSTSSLTNSSALTGDVSSNSVHGVNKCLAVHSTAGTTTMATRTSRAVGATRETKSKSRFTFIINQCGFRKRLKFHRPTKRVDEMRDSNVPSTIDNVSTSTRLSSQMYDRKESMENAEARQPSYPELTLSRYAPRERETSVNRSDLSRNASSLSGSQKNRCEAHDLLRPGGRIHDISSIVSNNHSKSRSSLSVSDNTSYLQIARRNVSRNPGIPSSIQENCSH